MTLYRERPWRRWPERRARPACAVGDSVQRADDDLPLSPGGGQGGSHLPHHATPVRIRVEEEDNVILTESTIQLLSHLLVIIWKSEIVF